MHPHAIFKALGSKHRLQIIRTLAQGEKNVSAINRVVKISQPALSQHLKKLRSLKILSTRRNQREVFYSIEDQRVIPLLLILEKGHV